MSTVSASGTSGGNPTVTVQNERADFSSAWFNKGKSLSVRDSLPPSGATWEEARAFADGVAETALSQIRESSFVAATKDESPLSRSFAIESLESGLVVGWWPEDGRTWSGAAKFVRLSYCRFRELAGESYPTESHMTEPLSRFVATVERVATERSVGRPHDDCLSELLKILDERAPVDMSRTWSDIADVKQANLRIHFFNAIRAGLPCDDTLETALVEAINPIAAKIQRDYEPAAKLS